MHTLIIQDGEEVLSIDRHINDATASKLVFDAICQNTAAHDLIIQVLPEDASGQLIGVNHSSAVH